MLKLFKNLKFIDYLFLILVIALVVMQVWLELKMPDYTSKLTELIAYEGVTPGTLKMKDIWYNGGMMLLCAFFAMVAMMLASFFTANLSANISYSLRKELMEKVTTFSNVEMNKFTTPSLITRTTNDVFQIQMFAAMGIQFLIKSPVMALWAILKISNTSLDWMLATFCFVAAVLIVVITLVLIVLPKFKKIQKLTDDLNDITRENISGVRVIRAFNAEDYQNAKFEKVNENVTRTNLFTSRTLGIMQPFMMLCMNSLTVVIYLIGAKLINEAELVNKATVLGNMTAYTQVAMHVVMSFMFLVVIFVILPRTVVAAKRISEVLNTTPIIQDGEDKSKETIRGSIEFNNVTFSYTNDLNHAALIDISFKVNPGETVAIIGATGSGKTTLINLISRFYDATAGEIKINGRNIKDYKIEELNKRISLATQKAVLFSGDVKKNVTYGANYDEERFNKVVNLAQASFIYDLECKKNATVAQGGTNFSGGQKQRLAIARCLYKDADIYIFDDSFSALDYKTDMLVRKGINENYKDKTKIIVAQRIGTIRQADKIIVLDEGIIVGIGKHDELLKNCSVYKEIALSQLSSEELNVKEAE